MYLPRNILLLYKLRVAFVLSVKLIDVGIILFVSVIILKRGGVILNYIKYRCRKNVLCLYQLGRSISGGILQYIVNRNKKVTHTHISNITAENAFFFWRELPGVFYFYISPRVLYIILYVYRYTT